MDEWHRLYESMREVLGLAIQYEGSTLSDGTYRNALNQSGGYQNHHRVYGKAGETCPSCRRGQVLRSVQAQRSTFYCPVCQPDASSSRKASKSRRQSGSSAKASGARGATVDH